MFLSALGGSWPVLFWTLYLVTKVIGDVVDASESWWLGWYVGDNKN